MSAQNYSILIVDDDTEFHQHLRYAFRRQYLFSGAVNERQLVDKLASGERFDLLLLDLVLDDSEQKRGLEMIPKIKQSYPNLPIIVVTADRSVDTVVEAMKLGASNFLAKDDFDFDYWQTRFQDVIENNQLKAENAALRAEVSRRQEQSKTAFPFIGDSPQIQEIKRILRLVADAPDVTVLITGETGTGKEVAARYMHTNGARKSKPFQAVNLSAIQETLLESTLFGHKKGAFTGATRDVEGYFSQANTGILMLDEIGDIDHSIQVKLLRFLETKQIRPVGSESDITLDVQVITATHRNLAEAVQQGRFRADLYQRLKAMVIELPPLRERREDIPLLLKHYLETEDLDSLFTPTTLRLLTNYHWVGNIRELKNTVGYMQLRARIQDKRRMDEHCLPAEIFQGSPAVTMLYPSTTTPPPMATIPPLDYTVSPAMGTNPLHRSIEEEHALLDLQRIEQLMVVKNKVKRDVAEAAGLENTDNLRYRIKKHYQQFPHLFADFPLISKVYHRIVKK